ncbi:hypothetical protein [Azonexus sp. R2A61]|uniref:hypothetical protein n=1 Tax=Azonexus sp. R2A61 TaxID=2744443 RepID=UPI001F2F032E|nr:hypothetical protein [Azonexus sp. R2A61]
MSKLPYAWMLGAMIAWRQRNPDADPEGSHLLLQSIFARAGVFRSAPTRSANDVAAALFILILVWWWNCAKNRANLVNPNAVLRKLTRGRFLGAIPADPAWLLASAWFWSWLTLCHFDHLPTCWRQAMSPRAKK